VRLASRSYARGALPLHADRTAAEQRAAKHNQRRGHRVLIGSEGITLFGQTYTPDKLVDALGRAMAGMIGLTAVERVAGLAVSILFGGFLTLVLMPYFMISAPRLSAGAVWLLPPERRRSVEDLALVRSSTCPMPFCWH
jgi:hypothetical protein